MSASGAEGFGLDGAAVVPGKRDWRGALRGAGVVGVMAAAASLSIACAIMSDDEKARQELALAALANQPAQAPAPAPTPDPTPVPPPSAFTQSGLLSATENPINAFINYNSLSNNLAPVPAASAPAPLVSATGQAFRGYFAEGTNLASAPTSHPHGDQVNLTATTHSATLSTVPDALNSAPIAINGTGTTGPLNATPNGANVRPGSYISTGGAGYQVLSLYNTLGTLNPGGPPTNQVQLSHSMIGVYNAAVNATGVETFGMFHAGTPATNMPTGNTTVFYSGAFQGREFTPTTNGNLNGSATLAVNFGTGSFGGAVTNIQADRFTNGAHAPLGSSASGYDLTLGGSITGTTMSGTAVFANTATPATTSTTSSGANGGFYGPGAREATGVTTTTGAVTGTPTRVLGGFATIKN